MPKTKLKKISAIPKLTPAAERQISRLCSLLKIDETMLKFEIRCTVEAAFIEGYNKKAREG